MEFTEGQQVEVRSEEKGSEDSWFTATIIKLLPNNDICIEYERDLMTEENGPSDPSRRSSVKASLIRPLPPQEPTDKSFQLKQLVDAFHQNGWWKGVITQLLDGSRYTVFFPNSNYMEFGLKDLRVHQDWIDGEWVKPQHQDIETERNQVDVRKNDQVRGEQNNLSKTQVQCLEENLAVPSPPESIERPDQQQCRRVGTRWRCSTKALPGKLYCDKHQLKQDIFNEKRRKGPLRQSQFCMDPPLPSGQRRCRRIGTGWRCHEMASPGLYCEKHQLEQNSRRKKTTKRAIEKSCLVDSGSLDECGGLYCEKHQLEQNSRRKKTTKRAIEQSCLVNSGSLDECGGKQVISGELSMQSGGEMMKRQRGRQKSTKKKANPDEVVLELGAGKMEKHREASINDKEEEIIQDKRGVGNQTSTIMETGGQSKVVSEASTEDPKYKTPSREVADVVQTSEGTEPIEKYVDGMDAFLASDWSFSSTQLNLNL